MSEDIGMIGRSMWWGNKKAKAREDSRENVTTLENSDTRPDFARTKEKEKEQETQGEQKVEEETEQ